MVSVNYRMRRALLLLAMCAVHANTKNTPKTDTYQKESGKTDDKSNSSTVSPVRELTGLPKNAIIAIEVVDPNESNSTAKGKGRKRTIDSALGYGYSGYQSFFDVKPKPPKYEVYKYSQHDIPPYKGPVKNVPVETYPDTYQNYHSHTNHGGRQRGHGHRAHALAGSSGYNEQVSHGHDAGSTFDVQKSVQYDLGSAAPVYEPPKKDAGANLEKYYQHGATLFSSLDHNGHLSSLSSQVPAHHGPMVPVIILRVYTNQLGQNSLHANIPQGHPYANLNSVDLQSLLAGYVQNHPHSQQYYDAGTQSGVQATAQPEQNYYHSTPEVYTPSHHQYHHQYQHGAGLLTNENYPDDAHTKVIFKKPISTKTRSKYVRARPPQKFRITIPENTYSKVEVQEHTYGGSHDAGQYVQQHVQYIQPQAGQHQGHQFQPQISEPGVPQAHYQHPYYYQQPEQYEQQQQNQEQTPQQEYQSSVQSLVQYQPIPADQKDEKQAQHQHQHVQSEQLQPDQVPYGPPAQQPSPQHATHATSAAHQEADQAGLQHYDAKQYVQIATYPSHTDPEQQAHQSHPPQDQAHQTEVAQQGSPITAEYYQQYLQYAQHQAQGQTQHPHELQVQIDPSGQRGHQIYQNPTGTEVQYLQRPPPEQGTENQDYGIVKHSNDAGRDLHPKLYNYHAHGSPTQQRGTPKKKRERKQRKSRVPLVLAPEVMKTLEQKQ